MAQIGKMSSSQYTGISRIAYLVNAVTDTSALLIDYTKAFAIYYGYIRAVAVNIIFAIHEAQSPTIAIGPLSCSISIITWISSKENDLTGCSALEFASFKSASGLTTLMVQLSHAKMTGRLPSRR
uniref:AlNc14C117G6570 protein n=1 Tax=Albugo laibachii Nc14 TaxID=890382 RepID=F0WJ39_9STRA|nr:AlNc14C117G6570 [Albugo laibachii Nc14]CCA21658.1 AlNc14C129G6907 [Albugo laibachii Nc14]|eukprot:CCA21658.1 AlNc14C129G6907 [Albugo laibachii Nc14]